jgi:signal transduction histidine kinase
MMPLSGYQIAFVGEEPVNFLRAEGLRLAGANVRVCVPQLDLWTALGDATYDAVVLLSSEAEPSMAAIRRALLDDPRTRELPVLFLVHPALAHQLVRASHAHTAAVLNNAASDDELVSAIVELAAPRRMAMEAHRQQRFLHDQLRTLVARNEQAQSDLNDLAHDMRSLLGVVFGFACNLRDEIVGALSDGQREHVSRILSASRDATSLLDRTKNAMRVPAPLLPSSEVVEAPRGSGAQRTLIDLGELADNVVMLFQQAAHDQAKTLSCRRGAVSVWGDALKLRQVLTNLVVNGIKYTPSGGQITVTVDWADGAEASGLGPPGRKVAKLVVSDTGPGISPEYRSRIFERGFRLQEHVGLAGKGIGLAIVHEIVAQHGGQVRVDSEPAQGTRFSVMLPCDRRLRDRHLAVLMAPDHEQARRLIEAIRAAEPGELKALLAQEPGEFMRLAGQCGAAVLVPRDEHVEFASAIARLRGSRESMAHAPEST